MDLRDVALSLLLPSAIGLLAYQRGSLTRGGSFAAACIGAISLTAAWSWGAYLIVWFVLASVLSRIGRTAKAERLRGLVQKGDRRDAWQVLSNGGVFALCAIATLCLPYVSGASTAYQPLLAVAAAGALAAAGADTWATEIGTLIGGTPLSLRTRSLVPIGTSGAVTPFGTIAAIIGGIVLAAIASLVHMYPQRYVAAVAIGAFVGSWADTALGAWWQERRWCPRCQSDTEQRTHECGTETQRVGGFGPLNNDTVNLCCTVVGAAVATLLVRLGGS